MNENRTERFDKHKQHNEKHILLEYIKNTFNSGFAALLFLRDIPKIDFISNDETRQMLSPM